MAPKNFSIVSECPIIGNNLIGAVVLLDTAGIPGEVKGKRWLAGKVVPIAEEGEAALDELDKKREPLANFCIKFNKTGALGTNCKFTGFVAAELTTRTYGLDKRWVLLAAAGC